jgi:hypothetical protein
MKKWRKGGLLREEAGAIFARNMARKAEHSRVLLSKITHQRGAI